MNKKIIIGIIAAIVVIGGTVGTVLGVQAYNTNKEYEALQQNLDDCIKMINNTNIVYTVEDDVAKRGRQHFLDEAKAFEEKVKTKDMSDDEKNDFANFVKSVRKHYEDDKNETKNQFNTVQSSKDSHTEEGYYSDEFNNEWNGLINQFNEAYDKGEYFNAFQNVLTMQNKLNEYVAGKDKEAADKAEAERQQQEAEQTASKKSGNSSSSSKRVNTSNNEKAVNNESSVNNENSSNEGKTESANNRRQLTSEEQQKDAEVKNFFTEQMNQGARLYWTDENGNITSVIN